MEQGPRKIARRSLRSRGAFTGTRSPAIAEGLWTFECELLYGALLQIGQPDDGSAGAGMSRDRKQATTRRIVR